MMQGLSIRPAGIEDIPVIREMAGIVFRETYKDILSPEQMEYMMGWMYSEDSLKGQIEGDGKEFLVAELDSVPCGYVSYELEKELEEGRKQYHLQKLYVLPEWQGKGIGRAMFEAVLKQLSEWNDEGFRIELNVNRYNSAVSFYEHIGMHRDRQGDFPIGKGYFMNDYIYAIDL